MCVCREAQDLHRVKRSVSNPASSDTVATMAGDEDEDFVPSSQEDSDEDDSEDSQGNDPTPKLPLPL